MTEPHEYMQAMGLEPVQYGPALPIAYCRSCRTQLVFEPVRRGAFRGWCCHCPGCIDGGYGDDGLGMSIRSGEGESPWAALDECAALGWDVEAVELLVRP